MGNGDICNNVNNKNDKKLNFMQFACIRKSIPLPPNIYFFKDFLYLFLERGEGREKEWERNISV